MAIADAALVAPHQFAGPTFRITALTSRLLRLEHSPDGRFTDAPTQVVQDRDLDAAPLRVVDTERGVELFTEHVRVRFDGSFTPAGLEIDLLGNVDGGYRSRWRHGQPVTDPLGVRTNLFGTARTLDYVDGECELEPGLLSMVGHALLDDSASLELDGDAWPRPRHGTGEDLYFFGYGRDYQAALRDWFRLAGASPLLPRWALGTWWSRYHRYDEHEYLDLLDRFAAQRIPLSVAVIDMDWHVTDVDPSIGSGWTGYTWNRELFPDPPRFLTALHERGLKVSLNTHPADGIRRHEDAYERMCAALGRPADGTPLAFDIGDRAWAQAYLEQVHHPLEAEGVDFWWVDWQQGAVSSMPGLDPLWMLDHLHYLDSGRDGARPLTFSRYAGPGSHRYPVGFSGDTVVSWDSLAFQPYFTATAANIGYHWWSHDIGGHFQGGTSDELATRWLQLGVFSPITRLHSSNDEFNSKEPWRFGPEAEAIQAGLLRWRHRLVPYLYSAMWAAHTDGIAPVRPLYHDDPAAPQAYAHGTEFRFGPDLLVAPIVTPDDPVAHLGSATAWLPDGAWRDLFTGRRYAGGRTLCLHRPLDAMPVLARVGAVIPLATDPMAPLDRADALTLRVVIGADGGCTVVEDDGSAQPQRWELPVTWREDGDAGRLTVGPQQGGPTERDLTVELLGAVVEGAEPLDDALGCRIPLGRVDLAEALTCEWPLRRLANPVAADVFTILDRADIPFVTKNLVHQAVRELDVAGAVGSLDALDLPPLVRSAVIEVLTAG